MFLVELDEPLTTLQEISDIESTILKDSPTGKILTLSNLTLETKKNEILNSVFVFIY
ncbi:MAG: hypothetical protein IPI52_06100 [Bacteroidetes bacterium]|nr:hypothetical protein [Bacteroidota bacterium]